LFLDNAPSSANPVPGFTRQASKLQKLHLHFGPRKDVRALLDAEFLPVLDGLSLDGGQDSAALLDHLRALTELTLFARLRCLLLSQLPVAVVTGILARHDLSLQRLELARPTGHDPDSQRILALARSPTLAGLAQLTVRNERVGDVVLRLVEATAPGRLETLELVNVGLTDEGVARLARLPQLSNVSLLNLQENEFTSAGLAELLRSPHLGKLRRLELGGRPPWSPYYSENPVQALGDDGAAALASSGLLAGLDELVLCSAAVGPRGAAALAGANAPRLRRLGLAHNPLGSAGAAALTVARFLPGLRELDLSLCELDDAAVRHLSEIALPSLLALGLGYNSIGPAGARHLADAAGLTGLRLLNLHDNFVDDEGLIALAGSASLTGLVELDLEQDVWNYRCTSFGDEAARAVASSEALARLDSFFAGVVDEYHGGPCEPPFRRQGQAMVASSTRLRLEARASLLPPEGEEQPDQVEQTATDNPNAHFHHYTPREVEQGRRAQDFRGLSPPELPMDERQWLEAADPAWMLEFLGERAGQRKRHLFACACARRALRLQPNELLAEALAIAEQLADGVAAEEARERGLQAFRTFRSTQQNEELGTNISAAVHHALNASTAEAVNNASRCGIWAAIADVRRRRPGSVARVSYTPEHVAQAALIRCLFGNPHRVVRLPPEVLAWNDGTVVKMARAIDEARSFEQLPILADALEEAGCEAEVLNHCRQGGEHVYGCWIMDWLLGR
jgi:hypothetical protein